MATITATPVEQSMQESMSRLEAALLAPPVSGELKNWTAEAIEALQTFGPAWIAYVKEVLHPQYTEIAKSDNDLLRRVEQMLQEDKQLVTDLNDLQSRFHEFAKRAEVADKHESKIAENREALEQAGIALLVRIKKQQSAAATWLYEAQYRERGAGD